MARKKQDALQVQVALKIRAPRGTKIAKSALKDIMRKVLEGEKLPPNVKVDGIFWRNPNRSGQLSYWRYHEGANLRRLKARGAGVESAPRGSLQDAIDTLSPFLETGNFEL